MSATYDVSITACDSLNLGAGYNVKITDSLTGSTVLFTSKDPNTGEDISTLEKALRVVSYYTKVII